MLSELVRVIGLEPTRLAATEPKSVASTSFATPATAHRPGCVHLSDVKCSVKGRVAAVAHGLAQTKSPIPFAPTVHPVLSFDLNTGTMHIVCASAPEAG